MSYCEIVSNSTRRGKQTEKVSKVSVTGPKIESDRVTKGERGPGRRRGRQDKPSGTEIYGACVRGRGSLGSRSGVKRVKRDILTLGTENEGVHVSACKKYIYIYLCFYSSVYKTVLLLRM